MIKRRNRKKVKLNISKNKEREKWKSEKWKFLSKRKLENSISNKTKKAANDTKNNADF